MKNRYSGKKTVLNKNGIAIGIRHVIYSRERKVYLHRGCCTETTSRFDAWSGNRAQGRYCMENMVFSSDMALYLDGEEKGD